MSVFLYDWDGDAMVPRAAFKRRCDEEFVVGEIYRLEAREERSINSHRHYFACIREAWMNLPEHLAEQYASPEHLRKKALIKAGYRNERSVVCDTPAQATKVAAFLMPIDEYGAVVVRGNVVYHLTAKSQSMKAMGKKEFAESKEAVLNAIAALIDVTPEELRRSAA
jgi:hypothetical protein